MAKDVTLKNNDGEALYPITRTTNVYDENNKTVELRLQSIEELIKEIPDVSAFATKEDLQLYLPLTGGTLSGDLEIKASTSSTGIILSTNNGIYPQISMLSPSSLSSGDAEHVLSRFGTQVRIGSPNLQTIIYTSDPKNLKVGTLTSSYVIATTSHLAEYLPLTGGTLTGPVSVPSSKIGSWTISTASDDSLEFTYGG